MRTTSAMKLREGKEGYYMCSECDVGLLQVMPHTVKVLEIQKLVCMQQTCFVPQFLNKQITNICF